MPKRAVGLAISTPDPASALARLEVVAGQARDYAAAARAPNTVRGYRSDWADFARWCAVHGQQSLPASGETVALYLTDLAPRRKASTLQRRISTISQAHKTAGLDSPTLSAAVHLVWAGIRRTHGTAQQGKVPVVVEDLRAMVGAMAPRRGQPWRLLELRDRALLLIGFTGAFRRSELVGLDVADLEFSSAGLVINLRRSKTDQEGQGRRVGIPRGHRETCPVTALQAYLSHAGIQSGAVFRATNRHGHLLGRLSDRGVALVVKRPRGGGWAGPRACCRPQPALRAGNLRGGGRRQRALDHESDRPPLGHDGPPVHPRWRALSRQRRGGCRPVKTTGVRGVRIDLP